MGIETKIGWTDHTFNTWWGCEEVSPGCKHCYAKSLAKRYGHDVWGRKPRRFLSDHHWKQPLAWNAEAERAGVRRRVFCSSMADVFEIVRNDLHTAGEMIAAREKLWKLIAATPHLDWQLLTKRPENIAKIAPWRARADENLRPEWPANVWIGTTCEDQQRADERLPHLLPLPAAVRFVSAEPLLGPLDLGLPGTLPKDWGLGYASAYDRINWVIVGGESGGGARRFDLRWAQDLVDDCQRWKVPCFVKQLGAKPTTGELESERLVQLRLKHRKGEDPTEWPDELRVREFPRGVAA